MSQPADSLRSDARRNRAALLRVGAEAFAELGYDAPVSEIARRAGLAKGTFFRHFPTKEALVNAILIDHYQRLVALIEEIEATDELTGVRALEAYMERAAEQLAPDRSFWEAAHSAGSDSPEMHATSTQLDAAIGRLLSAAQREGSVRSDIQAIDIQTLVTAATNTTAPLVLVAPELWRRYLALMIDGIRSPGHRELPVAALSVEDFPDHMDKIRRAYEARAESQ
jgi:AcrR family transcriptional regulator